MSDSTLPKCENCGNYDADFIEELKAKVYRKIAFETSKDLSNLKYDLGLCSHIEATVVLSQYIDILDRLLECDSCLKDEDVESIVSTIKNKLK